jgi:hypothetical protein
LAVWWFPAGQIKYGDVLSVVQDVRRTDQHFEIGSGIKSLAAKPNVLKDRVG